MKKYNYSNHLDNILFKFANASSYSFLIEGITELQRYYPKLDEKQLRGLVALDPTYKGGDNLGKYGKWIITLFYNNIKNIERLKQYREYSQRPENQGKTINQPTLLPAIKKEDLYKVTDSLKLYDTLKGKINKPITAFKTLPELDTELAKFKNEGVPTDKEALRRYNTFKSCEKLGLKKIYESPEWIIGIPTTLESSVPFGEYTSWCTTSSHGRYYNYYTQQGDLFILLNKENGELYQFHFETTSFMDEHDQSIDMDNFTQNNQKVCDFLYSYKSYGDKDTKDPIEVIKEKFKKIITDETELKRYFHEPEVKDLKVEGEMITGKLDISDLPEPSVYDAGSSYNRDGELDLETIAKILEGDTFDWFWDVNYRLSDFYYQASTWDNAAKKYNVPVSFDDIKNEEYPEELREIFEDDFYNDVGILSTLSDCAAMGSQAECERDVVDTLKGNLPITVWEGETIFKVELPLKSLYKMLWNEKAASDSNFAKLKFVDYDEKYQPSLNIGGNVKAEGNWYRQWSNGSDGYDDDDRINWDSWLWKWRRTFFDGGRYKDDFSFYISEPRYGWSGFDDSTWEDACETAAKRCSEILNKEK